MINDIKNHLFFLYVECVSDFSGSLQKKKRYLRIHFILLKLSVPTVFSFLKLFVGFATVKSENLKFLNAKKGPK